jgi:hypothetical protein
VWYVFGMPQDSIRERDGTGPESPDAVLEDIERIVNLKDAPIRNLWITYRYHTLMGMLFEVIGTENANWSTFATWASKTAGESIRGQEVPQEIRQLLADEMNLQTRLRSSVHFPSALAIHFDPLDLPRAVLAEVSQQIAIGNLLVFQELAPLFARFRKAFPTRTELTKPALQAFISGLRDGPPERDGQDLLKTAFTSYFAAAESTKPKEKAEYTLYGNLLIGLHEQTRLQPYIAGALDAPFADRTYEALLERQPDWLEWIARPAFREFLRVLRLELKEVWERLATRYLMRLALPDGGSLSLGVDIPVGVRPFPKVLTPLEQEHLVKLVKSYDPHLDTLKGSGSRNWTKLESRMAFIADLFRSRQQDPDLFRPPFAAHQLEVLRAGRLPDGPL